jgi:hypothetical protein
VSETLDLNIDTITELAHNGIIGSFASTSAKTRLLATLDLQPHSSSGGAARSPRHQPSLYEESGDL